MVTQKDIAESLGISQPAVGAVLGRYSKTSSTSVSAELRDRILRKARDLGYRPNIFAQNMRTQKTGVIGVIHFTGFLQAAIQREIHMVQAIAARGSKMIPVNAIATHKSGFAPAMFEHLVDQMIDFQVDGVILSTVPGLMPTGEVERLKRHGIPCVSMSGKRFPDVPYVGADSERGFEELTNHLIERGYRNLVLIMEKLSSDQIHPNAISVLPKFRGFSNALKARAGGVDFLNGLQNARPRKNASLRTSKNRLQGHVFSSPGSMDLEETYKVGYRAVNSLLDLGAAPDVILLPNDDWLQGALLALSEQGIKVPEQMGLTGYDASPYGQFGTVPFSTVAQPHEKIAQRAVEILFDLIAGENVPADTIVRLPCVVVPGRTVVSRLKA